MLSLVDAAEAVFGRRFTIEEQTALAEPELDVALETKQREIDQRLEEERSEIDALKQA